MFLPLTVLLVSIGCCSVRCSLLSVRSGAFGYVPKRLERFREEFDCLGATTEMMTTAAVHGHLPSGPALAKLVRESFNNVDSDHDGFIERYEFDTLVIIADSNNDGCMTLDEYKSFSAGTPDIATKLYQHFDVDNTNCLTVDKVADQFAVMDSDMNKKVTPQEFESYYISLLHTLFNEPDRTVG